MNIKLRLIFAAALTLTIFNASAQSTQAVVKLRGTRLTYPLVNKWIEEFNKEYPQIRVAISPTSPVDSIDFSIASYPLNEGDLKEGQQAVIATNYVQLLIVSSSRPGLDELKKTGVTEQNLGNLFFQPTPNLTLTASAQPSTLYVRDKPVCAVKAFASHYGSDAKTIAGTGIKGDDQDLAESVKKDPNGIAFNNLGFIYDVSTRKVQPGLAIVPLDLNGNNKIDENEKIYNTLDDVIHYIETTNSNAFVNSPVNFIFNKNSSNRSAFVFLNWALTKGQEYNHALGFLNLDTKTLTTQTRTIAPLLPTSTQSCEGTTELMKKRRSKQSQNP